MFIIKSLVDFFYKIFFSDLSDENYDRSIINLSKPLIVEGIQLDTTNSRLFEYIVLHCSATKDGVVQDTESIRKWHMGLIGSPDPKSSNYNKYIAKPMSDIGYHGIIERINNILTFIPGRSLSKEGGHCLGLNEKGLGICVIGSFDKKPPDEEQLEMLVRICKNFMKYYCIPPRKVIGHWESFILLGRAKTKEEAWKIKTCPGKMWDLQEFRRRLIQ